MPDDHSKSVPLLPIPNRTVKRLRADDSADSRVKVGHRQAPYSTETSPVDPFRSTGLFLSINVNIKFDICSDFLYRVAMMFLA
jgi:hypothetical protein